MSNSPQIIRLGTQPYEESLLAMRQYTDGRDATTPDQLWIVEHPPVFTLGLGADRAHILNPHQIPVVQTDRGGEVTYHGPGQVVIYLLLDLKRQRDGAKLFVREFVHGIEEAVIRTLAAYNLAGERKEGAPGIYVSEGAHQGAKIAALGLKVRLNGCTYHGVSLNVDMDLSPFAWINPCGYRGLETTDMKTLGVTVPLHQVQETLAQNLIEQFAGYYHDN